MLHAQSFLPLKKVPLQLFSSRSSTPWTRPGNTEPVCQSIHTWAQAYRHFDGNNNGQLGMTEFVSGAPWPQENEKCAAFEGRTAKILQGQGAALHGQCTVRVQGPSSETAAIPVWPPHPPPGFAGTRQEQQRQHLDPRVQSLACFECHRGRLQSSDFFRWALPKEDEAVTSKTRRDQARARSCLQQSLKWPLTLCAFAW